MAGRVAVGGATGFLGSYLCAWFLAGGHEVVAFAREQDGRCARERVEAALSSLQDFGELPLEKLRVLSCDLISGELNEEAGSAIAGVPFVNTIASLKHGEQHRAEIEATNVEGTRRLVEGLTRYRAARLYHVSTAYVCGSVAGEIAEKPAPADASAFNNLYEFSKARAERIVLAQDALPADVLRPSIIVGSSKTGWARNFTGYYTLYEVLRSALARAAAAFDGKPVSYLPLRLPGDPGAFSDVVPVNYVAECIGRLVELDAAGRGEAASHQILHIVSRKPRTTAYFLGAMQSHLCFEGAKFVPPSTIQDPHPLERWCGSRLKFNNCYTVRDYRFRDDKMRTRLASAPVPECPEMDAASLARINDFFSAELDRSSVERKPAPSEKLESLRERLGALQGFLTRNRIEPTAATSAGAALAGALSSAAKKTVQ